MNNRSKQGKSKLKSDNVIIRWADITNVYVNRCLYYNILQYSTHSATVQTTRAILHSKLPRRCPSLRFPAQCMAVKIELSGRNTSERTFNLHKSVDGVVPNLSTKSHVTVRHLILLRIESCLVAQQPTFVTGNQTALFPTVNNIFLDLNRPENSSGVDQGTTKVHGHVRV